MNSFIESWTTSQKKQEVSENERTCSDNDTSDSEETYSQSFKFVALKTKRAQIGIPTTEIIGETTVNGSKNCTYSYIYR
jgi:hypothetical protein